MEKQIRAGVEHMIEKIAEYSEIKLLADAMAEAESKVALYRANKMYDWAIAHIRRCEEDSKV